jgi:putative SOS response-associated peptidase YedK
MAFRQEGLRYPDFMCGRVIHSSALFRLAIVDGLKVSDSRVNVRPRYNAAPSQELLVIRENHKTGERSLDLIKWGLIPHWWSEPRRGPTQDRERFKSPDVTIRSAVFRR